MGTDGKWANGVVNTATIQTMDPDPSFVAIWRRLFAFAVEAAFRSFQILKYPNCQIPYKFLFSFPRMGVLAQNVRANDEVRGHNGEYGNSPNHRP